MPHELARLRQGIRPDMHHKPKRRVARHRCPRLGEAEPFRECERSAFSGRAANEHRLDPISQKMRSLGLDRAGIERTVWMKRRVRGRNKAVEWMGGAHED